MALLAAPTLAQRQGGTATLGLETDIPGFDPLKVGSTIPRRGLLLR